MRASLRVTTAIGLVAGLLVAMSGCAADRHGARGPVQRGVGVGVGEPVSPGPVANPLPAASVAAARQAGAKGDLSVAITGGCVMVKDAQGKLWLKFGVTVNWLGTTGFPATAYEITTQPAAAAGPATTNPVNAAGGQVAMVGGDPASLLGQRVVLTATIDPQRRIPEINEGNNSASVTATFPATAPSGTQEQSVPCTNG